MANSSRLKQPARLKKGDTVGVVAPAGPVEPDLLEKGMQVLKRMGYTPLPGKHLLARRRYLAGEDAARAEDLMAMFANPDVRGIVCARGGYGVNRILPLLDAKVIRKNPKIVVGASDCTLLLLYLLQKCGLVAFHGPMVAGNFGAHPMPKTKGQFQDLLSGKAAAKKLAFSKGRVLVSGSASAPVTGGCLTLLCRSLKTPHEIQTKNRILLIEDVNEPPYRIDGMLWQLREAGKFRDLSGVVLGEMVGCAPSPKTRRWMEEGFLEVFEGIAGPVVWNAPIGHGTEMWTVPLGVQARLTDTELKLSHCGVA